MGERDRMREEEVGRANERKNDGEFLLRRIV